MKVSKEGNFDELTHRVKHKEDELSAFRCLYALSILPASADSLKEISSKILATAIKLSDADKGTFRLISEKRDVLEITAHYGLSQAFLDFFVNVHAGGGALAERKRIFVENVSESPIFAGTPAMDVLLTEGVRAIQSTPLITRSGRLVGMLATHYRKVTRENELDLHYIDLLAAQAADIIEHVHLDLERRRLEEERERLLQASEEQRAHLQAIIEALPVGLWVADESGKMSFINDIARKIWGGSIHHAKDTGEYSAYKAWWADTGERISNEEMPLAQSLRGETCDELVVDFERFDGVRGTQLVSSAPIRKSDGAIIGSVAIMQDITELMRLQHDLREQTERLRRSERHYRTLVENLPVVVTRYDRNLRYLYRAPQWDDIFGIPSKEIVGKNWREIGYPEERYSEWMEILTENLETARIQEFEVEFPVKGGEIRNYLTRVVPEFDSQGSVESLLIVSMDITELRKAYEVLRQSEERFRKIFQKSPDVINIIRMRDNRYIDINQAFTDVLGYSREEVVSRTPAELNIEADDNSYISGLYKDFTHKGKLLCFPVNYRAKSGKIVNMLCSTDRITLGGEECRLTILKDVTKEKQIDAELQRLDRLNTVGEMAAAIGHEVRNPMTTVRGYLQMFQRKAEYAKHREQFKTMIEELDRANQIISDFLSLAKNRMVELKSHNLNDVVCALLPLLQAEALRSGHEIKCDMGELPDFPMDDKEIRQLILNFVRNGFEAMKSGGRLTIMTYAQEGQVVLGVHDTGPGIPPQVLKKLGTPFITTKENGTGLGISVCYRIAQRHGASIDVKTSSEGATFFVYFPVNDNSILPMTYI